SARVSIGISATVSSHCPRPEAPLRRSYRWPYLATWSGPQRIERWSERSISTSANPISRSGPS
ncbi:MAG: hypothetical protein WBG53_01020, partial [Rhodococcus sp. (in: high G+C Gram-positive bacteria)]